MSRFAILRCSVQTPAFEGIVPYVATGFFRDGNAKVLKVGVGMTPEAAVDDLADRMAYFMNIRKVDLLPMLRKIALGDQLAEYTVVDSGDADDIPF